MAAHQAPPSLAKATLWVKAQHEGALPPPCIVRKDPRVKAQHEGALPPPCIVRKDPRNEKKGDATSLTCQPGRKLQARGGTLPLGTKVTVTPLPLGAPGC